MYGHRLPANSKLRRKVTLTEFEPSEVDIERSHECEIKNIVERHIKTRQPLPTGPNEYLDATTIPNELQERLHMVQQGQQAWQSLSNDVKRQYRTPQEFLHALNTPSEERKLNALGIFKQTQAQESNLSKPQGEPAKPGGASPSGT